MRYSVLVTDVLVFFSGVCVFVRALWDLFLHQRGTSVIDKVTNYIESMKSVQVDF